MGFGYIGKVTAQRAHALGMTVLAYDPFVTDEAAREFGAEKVDLDEGLARADFVSVHVRLMPETTGLVDLDLMRKMKPSAVLINVARGPLVNEADLIEAVKTGVIRGAVLDVVCHEPIAMDDPLLSVPGILITPTCPMPRRSRCWTCAAGRWRMPWPCTGGAPPGPDPRVKAIKQYPARPDQLPGRAFFIGPRRHPVVK